MTASWLRLDPTVRKPRPVSQCLLFVALVVALATGVVQNAAAQSAGLVLSETTLTVEEASSASYTVKLATQPTAAVEVSIGGTSGTDLSLDKTTLTFTTSNWNTAQTVTVSAVTDDDATHDSATLTHAASGGGYGSVTADLPVTVTDTTRMRLAAIIENVGEGESMPIRATLPMPLDEDVAITVSVTPNGGRPDEYELSTQQTLQIATGATESTGEVTFTSLDDFMWTGTRSFNATLTADHPRVDPDTEEFVVIDDDRTRTGWSVTPPAIFENGGETTLTAFKTSLHQSVVRMTLSLEPADRATLSSTTLTFQPGALYATETPTITAVDNATADGDQTVTITATVTEGRGVRTPSPLSLTILDDDGAGVSPTVALRLTPSRVREGLVSTVTAQASHALDAEATITVSASPGHADTRTSDYVLSTNTVLTIPAGGMTSTGVVTIATIDDQLGARRARVVTVSGALTGGGGVASPADQTLTVIEDDSRVAVAVVATPATILEGEVSTITLRALEPVPADLEVTLSESHDAAELSDNTVLTIARGQTESTDVVTLTAVDDADMRNAVVTVRGTPSASFVSVRPNRVYIIDDDFAATWVIVSPVPDDLYEGETSTVLVELTQPLANDVTVTIGVDETDENHNATAADYTLSANRTLTVPAGSMRSTGVVSLTATDDEYYGPLILRTVGLDIVSVTGIDRAAVSVHSDWRIYEDEAPPRVTLEVTPASISENGGQSTVTAKLNTKLRSDAEVTVTAAPAGITQPGDFTQTGTMLTIPAGTKTSTGTVTISAVDDRVDGPDKLLVVTGTVAADEGVWDPYAEGLTIRDDDATEGQWRLVDGAVAHEGRLELLHNGAWGTVCDDYWTDIESDVACRAVGYAGGAERSGRGSDQFRRAHFGQGTGAIWLDDVNCEGDEASPLMCLHRGVGVNNCTHTEDVGVRCSTTTTPRVVSIELSDAPGGNGRYDAGETLEVTLVWSEPVRVSTPAGALGPKVWVGYGASWAVRAEYASGSGTARTVFAHTLTQADKSVDDGEPVSYEAVQVYRNSLRLRGGAIASMAASVPALLGHDGYPDAARQLEAAAVVGLPGLSAAGADGVWGAGETVEVTLAFSRAVTVDTAGGTPSVGLLLGGSAGRSAAYLRGSGTTVLVFGYTLTDDDGAHTALLVPENSLALNGGAIRAGWRGSTRRSATTARAWWRRRRRRKGRTGRRRASRGCPRPTRDRARSRSNCTSATSPRAELHHGGRRAAVGERRRGDRGAAAHARQQPGLGGERRAGRGRRRGHEPAGAGVRQDACGVLRRAAAGGSGLGDGAGSVVDGDGDEGAVHGVVLRRAAGA